MKFKNKQDYFWTSHITSEPLGDRGQNSGFFWAEEDVNQERDKGASRALVIFYIFIRMVIIQVYTDVNTYQIVHWISVHLLIGMP